jgi:hypothetical protein
MKKQIKELVNNSSNIIPAIRGNFKALWNILFNHNKYLTIKQTADILSKCPNNCSYTLECCGCSIYAAVEENKQCKWKTIKK